MSVIGSNILAGASGSQGYQISRSVRLRSSASATFSRTPASAGSTTKGTFSFWIKRGALSTAQQIYHVAGTSGNNSRFFLAYNVTTDTFSIVGYSSAGALALELVTTQVFRDPSAWYHIVIAVDTTQASSSNRVLLYINGVQVTAFGTSTIPAQNTALGFTNNTASLVGANQGATNFFDGYLTEINFIDGQALTPSSFGSTNATTGVWQPIKYTGTYGTNGFYLNFADNSAATAAAIGKDSSGNGNNWTPNNISVTAGVTYDSMLDVPTQWADGGNGRGNYAVFSPIDKGSDITLTNGNLTFTGSASGAGWRATRGTFGLTSGKWRFSIAGTVGASTRMQLGIARSTTDVAGYNTSQNIGIQYNPYDGAIYVDGAVSSYGSTYRSSFTFDCFIDCDNKKIWFAVDGTVLGSGNPDTGANPAATWSYSDAVFPVTQCYGGTWNSDFGQQPFAFTVSSATGFKALNTLNLPTPTILKGNQYFDATLYTGNGGTQSIVNSGAMQPDLVWVKARSLAYSNYVYDSVRGTGTTKSLITDATAAEGAGSANANLTSFDSSGFSLGTTSGINGMNANAGTFVGWQWKEGATQGFDIVTFTAPATNQSFTVNHNLGVTPSMIIVKRRDSATGGDWWTWHIGLGNNTTDYVALNQTAAEVTATNMWGTLGRDSTAFGVNVPTSCIANGTYVAYLFAAVAGYSAFGSYTGNGSADGTFVFTGFQPRFVMLKAVDVTNANDWVIIDTVRKTFNADGVGLRPNLSAVEFDDSATPTNGIIIDALSNGFKLRGTSTRVNGNGSTVIYAAFASSPFKNSLAF
jgi:hypothetical protein